MSQQVKMCPKCGTENKSQNAACATCFTSLTAVPTTLSNKPEATFTPPNSAQAAPVPSKPEVTREVPPASPMGGFPGGSIIAPHGTNRPVSRGIGAGAVIGWIVAILLIGGMAFGGWWFFMKPAPPDQVVRQMFEASKAKNADKVMALLCKDDIAQMGGPEAARKAMENSSSLVPANSTEEIKLGTVTYEGEDTALVEIVPSAKDAETMKAQMGADYKFCIVAKREDGKWKVGLQETGKRVMADLFKAAAKKGGGFGMPGMPASGAPPMPNSPMSPR